MLEESEEPETLYLIGHQGGDWHARLQARTPNGEPAVLLFTRRGRAEAYCGQRKLPQPWPILEAGPRGTSDLLRRAQSEGVRWLCVDPQENAWACTAIAAFLALAAKP
jgi:hypothetical protein